MGDTPWTFDLPSGTWRSDELTAQVIARAVKRSGVTPTVLLGSHARGSCVVVDEQVLQVHEYGCMFPWTDTVPEQWIVDRIGEHLARVLPHVSNWTLLPHLRRVDGTILKCSDCGMEFRLPCDYGIRNEGRAHEQAHPGHTTQVVRRPGDTVGWYGCGLGPVLTSVTLSEGAPIPLASSCKAPLLHAGDCECAAI